MCQREIYNHKGLNLRIFINIKSEIFLSRTQRRKSLGNWDTRLNSTRGVGVGAMPVFPMLCCVNTDFVTGRLPIHEVLHKSKILTQKYLIKITISKVDEGKKKHLPK
jgi:hypothetical protein